jgi:hypothetical protein
METKTNMVMNGSFTKLFYSNEFVTLNSIYLDFNLKHSIFKSCQKFYLTNINYLENKSIIANIIYIENEILKQYRELYSIQKHRNYLLRENLNNGSLKIYKQQPMNNSNIYLKISGIWESDDEYGITYKFIDGSMI